MGGGAIFAILEFTKGTKSGSLTISGRGGQEHIMQQFKVWEYFSFGVELWANFPISVCKIKNFISHKLRGFFRERKELRPRERSERKIFEVESSRTSDNALLASRTKVTFVVDP